MYLYENHLGGLFWTDYEWDYGDLYCEQCGDSDWFLGEYETFADVLEIFDYDDTPADDNMYALKDIIYYVCNSLPEEFPYKLNIEYVNECGDKYTIDGCSYINEKYARYAAESALSEHIYYNVNGIFDENKMSMVIGGDTITVTYRA